MPKRAILKQFTDVIYMNSRSIASTACDVHGDYYERKDKGSGGTDSGTDDRDNRAYQQGQPVEMVSGRLVVQGGRLWA